MAAPTVLATRFSKAMVLRQRARTGSLGFRATAKPSAASRRQAGSQSDRRFSASGRVRVSSPTVARKRLRVSSNSRLQLAKAGARSISNRSKSGLSSWGRDRRTRRSHGRQRAVLSPARKADSISHSSSWFSSSVKNRLSAPMAAARARISASNFDRAGSSRAVEAARPA